jgi:superfamily II DNA or RNA helicase
MKTMLDTRRREDYRRFLAIKGLPAYSFTGHEATYPDEYQSLVTGRSGRSKTRFDIDIHRDAFDYQSDVARLAIRKQKFAVFADCGLGKTLILIEFARHAIKHLAPSKSLLIVSPLMVVEQTIAEARRWYPELNITRVKASELGAWTKDGAGIGITNYDALTDDIGQGRLGGMVLDESSMLKSHYGKWGQTCLRLGAGLEWKLCCTGTPAPNDRIEYANHAVFLDHYPTVNAFLARFFVNRGQTDNRWELKPHALEPFYRALSHWCLFLTNPATYGWKDNCGTLPPIRVHVEEIDLSDEQKTIARTHSGSLFATAGGIGDRATLSQLSKGRYKGRDVETRKFGHIAELVAREPDRGTLIWCRYNDEQDALATAIPHAGNIDGSTPQEKRQEIIADFKAGRIKVLISKPKILGFGLNLQCATRQIFSGMQDSYEEYYQAVKRSNRIGSTDPLDVYIPITELERPMIETVLRKAKMVERDTIEQERIFKSNAAQLV